jgi:uncharacterized repeat protein (TIGR01451 family)
MRRALLHLALTISYLNKYTIVPLTFTVKVTNKIKIRRFQVNVVDILAENENFQLNAALRSSSQYLNLG